MAGSSPQKKVSSRGNKIRITIDPVTRILGRLNADIEIKGGMVVFARISSTVYRGFERFLVGRPAKTAPQITSRVSGSESVFHAMAASQALNDAMGVDQTEAINLMWNLIAGAELAQSHILRYYQFILFDYVNGPSTAPYIPRYSHGDIRVPKAINDVAVGQYLESMEMRRICHEMVAIVSGRAPHSTGLVAGGITEVPTQEALNAFSKRLGRVKTFVSQKFLPLVYLMAGPYGDLLKSGMGYKNLISYGGFADDTRGNLFLKAGVYTNGKFESIDPSLIRDYVHHAWYNDSYNGSWRHERSAPNPDKPGAYSFLKSLRYKGKPHEVGPLARMWMTNPRLSKKGQDMLGVQSFRDIGDAAFSTLGRQWAMAEELVLVIKKMEQWLGRVRPGEKAYTPAPVPKSAEGIGLVESASGALMHYIDIKDGVINRYRILTPDSWNAGPMDDMGQLGTIEKALVGVPVPDPMNPVNIGRTIRSFTV